MLKAQSNLKGFTLCAFRRCRIYTTISIFGEIFPAVLNDFGELYLELRAGSSAIVLQELDALSAHLPFPL